jgi:hypothetical protein
MREQGKTPQGKKEKKKERKEGRKEMEWFLFVILIWLIL